MAWLGLVSGAGQADLTFTIEVSFVSSRGLHCIREVGGLDALAKHAGAHRPRKARRSCVDAQEGLHAASSPQVGGPRRDHRRRAARRLVWRHVEDAHGAPRRLVPVRDVQDNWFKKCINGSKAKLLHEKRQGQHHIFWQLTREPSAVALLGDGASLLGLAIEPAQLALDYAAEGPTAPVAPTGLGSLCSLDSLAAAAAAAAAGADAGDSTLAALPGAVAGAPVTSDASVLQVPATAVAGLAPSTTDYPAVAPTSPTAPTAPVTPVGVAPVAPVAPTAPVAPSFADGLRRVGDLAPGR